MVALAALYRDIGEVNKAVDATSDSLKIRKAALGDEHPMTIDSMCSYAQNLMTMGYFDDPKSMGRAADVAKRQQQLDEGLDEEIGPSSAKAVAPVEAGKGKNNKSDESDNGNASGDEEEGDDIADDESIKSITSNDLENFNLGRRGRRTNEADPSMRYASTLLIRVQSLRSSYFGADSAGVLEAQHLLALCYLEAGKLQEAHEMILDTIFLRQKVHGEDHPRTAESIVALAEVLRAQSIVFPGGRIGDKENTAEGDEQRGGEDSPEKSGRLRKSGPTLLDQLHSAIDKNMWKESASGALTNAANTDPFNKAKGIKIPLPQLGFMGYQFPPQKRLGRLGNNASRFANLMEDDASWLLNTASKIYQSRFGSVTSSLRFFSYINHCKAELERSRRNTGASRKAHELVLEHRRHLLPSGHPDIAQSLFAVAETYRVENKFGASQPLHEMARDMRDHVYGARHPLVADSNHALALLHYARGNYIDADEGYKQVLEIRREFLGPYHLAVAQTLNNIAGLAHINGHKDEAESMYRECLEVKQRVYGSDHPDYATALNNLGLLLKAKRSYKEAMTMYEKALDIQTRTFGKEHPDVASTLNNIAALLFAEGEVMKAQQLYRESIDAKRACLGPDHPSVAAALNNLAGLLYHTKQYEEAREFYEDALQIRTKAFGGDHPLVAETLNNIALMLATQGKLEDARMLYSRALIIKTNVFGEEHEVSASAMAALASVLQSLGKVSEARRLLDDTLEIRERILGEEHPDTIATANQLERLRVKHVLAPGMMSGAHVPGDVQEDSLLDAVGF